MWTKEVSVIRTNEQVRRVSLWHYDIHKEWVVEYIPGEWVRGRGPLFVRKEPPEHIPPGAELWECEVENPRELCARLGLGHCRYFYTMDEFWRLYDGRDVGEDVSGMWIADAVKLTRLIPKA